MPEIELSNRFQEGPTPATANRRRSGRILAVVPIRVIGQDASGRTFVEETVTICFNQQGARISLTHSLILDEIIVIRNLQDGIEEEFRVVGGFEQVIGNRREWGVEACDPNSDIWGIEFAPPDGEDQVKALIECAACKRTALKALSSIEYDVLLATAMISRHCDRCGVTTRWKPSQQLLIQELIAGSAPLASTVNKKRDAKRREFSARIRVRDSRGSSFLAETLDISKTGLCFVTTEKFQVGEKLRFTFPLGDRWAPLERVGTVRWAANGTNRRIYGVCFVK